MKKLAYVAHIRIPSETARTIQIAKMCEAFSESGYNVELICPFRIQINPELRKKDPFDYYNLKNKFKIRKMPNPDLVRVADFFPRFGVILYNIHSFIFASFVTFYLLLKRPDVIFCRSVHSALFLSIAGMKDRLIYESHFFPEEGITRKTELWILGRIRTFVTITHSLKEQYVLHGGDDRKILVAPDGVDMKMFDLTISKEEAREKLNIPLERKIVCYTGHLYDWKGVDVLALASKRVGALVYFVGGSNAKIDNFKEFVKNVDCTNSIFVGHVKPDIVPIYLKAADVLVIPNRKMGLSDYTSPLKLFEYMASKRPIVASDIPSLREILNEKNCLFVEPENPKALAEGINELLNNHELSKRISEQAYNDAKKYDWKKRVERIMFSYSNK